MPPANTADMIITNAKVATLASDDRMASAVAIKGDRFMAVGSDADISALADANTRSIDGQGRLVCPA